MKVSSEMGIRRLINLKSAPISGLKTRCVASQGGLCEKLMSIGQHTMANQFQKVDLIQWFGDMLDVHCC